MAGAKNLRKMKPLTAVYCTILCWSGERGAEINNLQDPLLGVHQPGNLCTAA